MRPPRGSTNRIGTRRRRLYGGRRNRGIRSRLRIARSVSPSLIAPQTKSAIIAAALRKATTERMIPNVRSTNSVVPAEAELPTIAVVGAGDVGSAVLRLLACSGEVGELWALDVDGHRAAVAAHDAAAIALYGRLAPSVSSRAVDVLEPDALIAALDEIRPDAIVQAATLQSWWVVAQLPPPLWRRLENEARFGPWLPFHLVPAQRVTAAAAEACPGVPVVNVAFPDAVNPVLAATGPAPTCGAGNSDLLRPGIRLAAAAALGVAPSEVELEFVGHHYHVVYFWMDLEQVEPLDPQSFHLRIRVGGDDVTDRLGAGAMLATAGRLLPRGRLIAERTAASAAKNARLLLRADATDDHAAAPCGLAGGYDVRFGQGTATVRLPAGLDADAARRIVERAQLGDGIAAIGPGGAVTFTERAAVAMRDILGYDCPVLRPDEAPARVEELRARLASAGR